MYLLLSGEGSTDIGVCNTAVGNDSSGAMAEQVRNGGVDVQRLDMPSFNKFKDQLEQVVLKAIRISTT